MTRIFILLTACLSLAACGGGGYRKAARDLGPHAVAAPSVPKVRRMATGPISRACMASDRKARSPELCGCIQAVANDTLSAADQRLAVTFYGDPHKAQEIRQSDNTGHERFWQSYKAYAAEAEASCG
ncbi:MAG: arginine transporter [Paracoccaceae bacterium]